MEPSAKPLFLVEDIMPERDRFIGCCWGCGIYFGSVVLMYVWVMFQMELDLFCGMFFRCFGRLIRRRDVCQRWTDTFDYDLTLKWSRLIISWINKGTIITTDTISKNNQKIQNTESGTTTFQASTNTKPQLFNLSHILSSRKYISTQQIKINKNDILDLQPFQPNRRRTHSHPIQPSPLGPGLLLHFLFLPCRRFTFSQKQT